MLVQNPSKAVNQNKCFFFFLFQCLYFPTVESEEAVIALWRSGARNRDWDPSETSPLSPELPWYFLATGSSFLNLVNQCDTKLSKMITVPFNTLDLGEFVPFTFVNYS